jgi:tryptophan synthase beta chain
MAIERENRKKTQITVIACVGGGSNAAGTFYHFVDEPSVKIIGSEAGGFGVNSGNLPLQLS